ncbi:hypothetical protein BUALT_Bualt05G0102000 [Buddleja alternifolia]|uniref:ENTH domain-containing protein n=1 Tax=Buddleja alternifolia TaxID=168488 RepID=A0AAV6XI21_9LAMI|nr:hypothetical protein BUALT_Bualt05G0102000 [Buddleja alternifolia]
MQRRIRQAFTSLKEHTCVKYAKIATIGGFCDIDLTIVKATSPDDVPLLDKYIHEFLKIFSISPSSYRAFTLSFTRRFAKTKSWRVALKCLLLLHRLLRSLPDHSPFRAELLWSRTNGLLSLYPCNFRDSSSSCSEDYTAFIISYARLLDETLDCISSEILDEPSIETGSNKEDQVLEEEDLAQKMKDLGRMIEILPQLQSLIDRVVDCRPEGAASRSFLVESAMKHVIRDGFSCYASFRRDIVMLLDNLIQLPYRSCVAAFGIYKKAALQANELSEYHEWCKCKGYCGSYEYPFVDRIPYIQIVALENFLNGMWQLTDHSSSSSNMSTRTSSNVQSPLRFLTDDDSDKQRVRREREFDDQVEKELEMEPLIQWEVDDSTKYVDWEDLLEASITTNPRNDRVYGKCLAESNGWQMQLYNPCTLQNSNPFHHLHTTNSYYGSYSCPNTPHIHMGSLI